MWQLIPEEAILAATGAGQNPAARLYKIREAQGEDEKRFFLTRRSNGYARKWGMYSWIWIDRI